MKWSKYNYIYKSPKHGTLLFNMLSGAFFDISDPETEADILKLKEDPDGYDFSDTQDSYEMLLSSGIICKDDDSNRNLLIYSLLSSRFNPNVKNLTILPTLDCNLACNYCFEEAHRCSGVMSEKVIAELKKYIKHTYHNKEEFMNLNWFGGEPLMGYSVMKELTEYIKSLDIPFAASIITNGILLNDEKIKELNDLNMKQIQITLDGDKETHDKKRVFKNGMGTYELILANMVKLHTHLEQTKEKIQVDIRINIDRENQDQYHKLFFDFKKKFPLFSVYPGIITQYQTCSTTLPCFANQREEAEFYINQYEKHGVIHPEFNISIKGLRSCMAEMESTYVVGPRGELYLCLQDVGNKDAEIGSLSEGKNNLPLLAAYCSGNLTFNSKECRDCNILTFCGGGCVNKQYRHRKYGEQHSMCAGYKDTDIFEKYLDLHYEIKKKHSNK